MGEGGGQGEDKFEDTQLFISKIYGLWAEGNQQSGRRQMWELVVSNCLAQDRPLLHSSQVEETQGANF